MTSTITRPLDAELERLPIAAPIAPRPGASKLRMFLVVNPRATTVSARLKNLVVYALRGRYDVDAVETEGRNHATELTRDAAAAACDLVAACAGGVPPNEAANARA